MQRRSFQYPLSGGKFEKLCDCLFHDPYQTESANLIKTSSIKDRKAHKVLLNDQYDERWTSYICKACLLSRTAAVDETGESFSEKSMEDGHPDFQ